MGYLTSDQVQPAFYNREEVKKITGYTTSGLYRAMEKKRFPDRVKLGPGKVAWRREEVKEWVQDPQGWCRRNGKA